MREESIQGFSGRVWPLNAYAFIRCDCGTQIKVPPAYKGQTIGCPHCGRPHMVGG